MYSQIPLPRKRRHKKVSYGQEGVGGALDDADSELAKIDATTTAAMILYLLGLTNGDRSSKPESVECSLEVEGRKAMIGAALSRSSL